MNFVVTGLSASGKSYQAKLLANRLNYKYINASQILLNIIYKGRVLPLSERGIFWFNKSDVDYINKIRDEQQLDVIVDKQLTEIAKNNDKVVFDSRTLPWLYKGKELIKIFLDSSAEDRYMICYQSRAKHRYTIEEIRINLDQKDIADIERFKRIYNININDKTVFDLIINNGKLKPSETSELIYNYISPLIEK